MKRVESEIELERLLASDDAELVASVSALRERGPDAAELATLASRLTFQGIDVTPQSAPAARGTWKKWALGGAGGLSAAMLWLGLRALPPAVSSAPGQAAFALATAASPPGSGLAQPPLVGSLGSPGARALAEPAAPKEQIGEVAAAPSIAESATTAPPEDAPPASTSRAEPRPEAAAIGALPTARPTSSAAPARAGASGVGLPSPSAADAPTEIELLRDARWALRQAPARALDFTDQHARLYPQGKLTQERELIAITALVALGRRTAALSRGTAFERAFPASPYRKQVGELLQ